MKRLLLLMFVCLSVSIFAQTYEKDYQKAFADSLNAQTEIRLVDGTRVDVLTDIYAIEVDWSKKWAESIGQSLYYAKLTSKRAGVVLIVTDPVSDEKYIQRLMRIACSYDIKVWLIYSDFTFETRKCYCYD